MNEQQCPICQGNNACNVAVTELLVHDGKYSTAGKGSSAGRVEGEELHLRGLCRKI